MKRLFSLLTVRKKNVLFGAVRGVRNRAIVESLEQRIAPATFTVVNTADSGAGSLRQAILDANGATGTDTIAFNIPGAGPQVIQPLSTLPAITSPVILDGFTQPGSSPNTSNGDLNTVIGVVLNGSLASSANGLVLASNGSTVRGLAIHSFRDVSGTADTGYGIIINGSNNTITGNFIGTDAGGLVDLGNRRDGIEFRGSNNGNVIGGGPTVANLISGNGENGIDFAQADNSANTVVGNLIGTTRNRGDDLGNTGAGIRVGVFENATLTGNVISYNDGGGIIIGGRAKAEANVLTSNTGDGIFVASTSSGSEFTRNLFVFNSGLGIDLQGGSENAAGVTANDVGDGDAGANGLQNYPVLTSATISAGTVAVAGSFNSQPSTAYRIEFFRVRFVDASGFGEGENFLGAATITTDVAGNAPINFSTTGVTGGQFITATATPVIAPMSTSEFAQNVIAFDPFQVTTTADTVNANDSVTSLREAILSANGTAGVDTITFAITGAGVKTITPTSALPTITDPVVIDGYSQLGATANTLAVGNNAALLIELNGNGGNFNGLNISAGGSTIRGLVLNRFGDAGIRLTGAGGNTIAGNFIGTDATGATALGNVNYGIFIGSAANHIGGTNPGERNIVSGTTFSPDGNFGIGVLVQGASGNFLEGNYIGTNASGTVALGSANGGLRIVNGANNTIGGTTAGAGNLLSGNTGNYNLQIVGATASGNVIQGNLVGTNATGTAPLAGASADGIQLIAPNNIVGGAAAGARNIISGNSSAGLRTFDFNGALGSGNSVLGNYIGLDITGTVALPNALAGLDLSSTGPNTIGGIAPGEGNRIAFNGTDGVRVQSGVGHAIRGNSIFSNTGLGLDLAGNGATANDFGDGDTGPNNLQNFPVITSASGTSVSGTINSTANTTLTLDFYSNPVNDNEGRVFLGSTNVTTDGSGNAPYTFTPGVAIAAGSFVTATATDGSGNTSEFSATRALAATFVWDGSSSVNWYDAANWTPAGVPGPADTAILNINGSIQIPTDTSVRIFQQSNGFFGSPAGVTFTVLENFEWSGGTQSNNAGTTVIPVGGLLTLSGGSTLNRTLINNGTANSTGGGFGPTVAGGGFTNNGTFNASGSEGISGVFTNAAGGIFNQTSGITTFFNGVFTNSGAVNIGGGTVNLSGTGTHTGSFGLAPAGTLGFTGGTHLLSGAVGGTGSVIVTNGTTTLDGTASYNLSGTTTVSGGTINFNTSATAAFGTLNFSNGVVSGSGNLLINTVENWSGGTMSGSGTTTIAAAAALNISGSVAKTLDGRTFNNLSDFAMLASTNNVTLANGATITNAGIWAITSDAGFAAATGGGSFANLAGGTLLKDGTSGVSTLAANVPLTNAGNIFVRTGTLAFDGGLTQNAGSLRLTGGVVAGSAGLVFNGGDLRGPGAINANLTINGGTVRPDNTGEVGTLTITGNYIQNGGVFEFEASGTATSAFDRLVVSGTATLGASATLSVDFIDGFTASAGQNFRIIQSANNPGTFANVTGETVGLAQAPDATGLVLAQGGIVFTWDNSAGNGDWFNSLNWDRDAGVPGAADTAILNIASTINLPSSTSIATFQQSNGSFSGAGTLTILNSGIWSGGILNGPGTTLITAGSTFAISGATDKQLAGRTLTVAGTATLGGTGNLRTEFDGTVNIQAAGVFDVQSDVSLVAFGGAGSGFVNNAGTFQKSGGTGTTSFSSGGQSVTLNNSGVVRALTGTILVPHSGTSTAGTFDTAAGAFIDFNAGYTFNTGTQFTGAGGVRLLGGTQTLSGAISSASLSVEGATIVGTHTITGVTKWNAGTFGNGTTTIPAGSTLAISGTANKLLDTRTLNLAGTATLSGTGNLRTEFSSVINVQTGGLFDVQSDASLVAFGGAGSGTVNNAGTFQKSGGTGTTSFSSGGQTVSLNNSGLVRALTGTILVAQGGTSSAGRFDATAGAFIDFNSGYTFNTGTQFTGGGEVRLLAGTQTLSGALSATNLKLAGATIAGTHRLGGNLEWQSGTLVGRLTLEVGSALNLTGATEKLLDGGNVINSGTITWGGTGNWRMAFGASIDNLADGTFEIQSDATMSIFGGAGSGTLTNAGLLRKSSSAGTTSIGGGQGPSFINFGNIEITTGTLAFQHTFEQAAGTSTRLNGGNLGGGITFAFQGGELRGVGTITGNVNNTGATIRPGGTLAAGTITIDGTYTQAAGGTLVAELGGTGAGQFDRLLVSGNATLDGTLSITHLGGFTPANGNTFRVVQSANNPTTFTTLTGVTAGKTQTADATGLVLAQAGLTFIWDAGAGGDTNWFNPLNWQLDNGFPSAGDAAILNINSTINLSAADATVASFQQTTGTLTGTKMLTVTDSLVWSGGAETGSGATTLAGGGSGTIGGTLTLNARTFNNAGSLAWTTAGTLTANSSAVFNNLAGATLDLRADGLVQFGGSGGNLTFSNAGTILKSAGAGAFTFATGATGSFVNTGTVRSASGAINFPNPVAAGGTFEATAGTLTFTGPTVLGGAATFNGIDLAGGTLSGTGTVTGAWTWSSGTINAALTIPAASALTLTGSADKSFGGTVNNNGTVTHTGAGRLLSSSSPVFNNTATGVLDIQTDAGWAFTGSGGNLVFNNSGLIQKSAGTGTTSFRPGTVNNLASGLVVAQTGTIDLPGNVSTAGILRATGGALTLSGATTASGTPTFDNIDFTAGSLGGTATVSGGWRWSGGTINGAVTIPATGAMTLTGSADKSLAGTVNNNGTVTHTGTGRLLLSSSPDFNNTATGLVDIQTDAGWVFTGSGGNLVFSNAGTLRKTAGVVSGFSGSFSNTGTVDVQTGALNFSSFTQTAGSTVLGGGGLGGGITFAFQGGELRGVGTITGNVNNTGATVRPGGTGTAGTLTITGNYTQSGAGVLAVELGGTSAGQFDVLNVSATATLGGTLNATLINGFTPAGGETFRALTALPRSGTFATVTGPLTAQYNANDVTLLGATANANTVVTTTLDTVNANDGVVSLREAITAANANAGTDTITFNIPGGGVQTLTVNTALPALTEAAVIDGYTQPGASANTLATGNNAVLNIVLRGASNTLGNGLTISASGVTVRGLVIQNFTDGIFVNGGNALIAGNWIGVSQTGTGVAANADDGIQVNASNATIGGTTPAARNVISGNSGSGIEQGNNSSGLNVQGNYLGTNAAGTASVGNAGDGITLLAGTFNGTIGGLTAAARNVISGNVARGVLIFGNTNTVQGNYIGTDATGMFAVKNSFDGLTIAAPGSGNFIGESMPGAGNVISGNDIAGITIESINSSPNGATGNSVRGNLIGVAADGVTPLGNTAGRQKGWGIAFFRNATDNTIGGTAVGEGNTIANNAGAGIAVLDAGPLGNRFVGNSIFANGDLGIDLGAFSDPANSVLPNDTGDGDTGPNGLLNYPVLTTAVGGGGNTLISGTYNGAANRTLTIEFFASPVGDPSGFGEGRFSIGNIPITTDEGGNASFAFPASTLAAGTTVSAAATLFAVGTSEFSRFIVATGAPTSTVVTTALDVVNANDGVTSLREAITFANSNSGLDTITFAIPGTGVQTIALTSSLPIISEALVIDGFSQPGAARNTNGAGLATNSTLTIALDGSAITSGLVNGLQITGGGSTVQGLVIGGFSGSGIYIIGAGGNTVLGNFIGVNAAGTAGFANARDGVEIDASSGNNVGDGTPGGRNVIAGNGTSGNGDIHNGAGVLIFNAGADTNSVRGNFIGTNSAGTAALANTKSGVGIYDSGSGNTVSTNVVSGNLGHGVDIAFGTSANTVQGNLIGTNAAGTAPIGNAGAGVLVNFTSNTNLIGGTAAGQGNTIGGNGTGGIAIGNGSTGNRVEGNFIGTNASGATGLGNIGTGLKVDNAANNRLGDANVPNVIGFNTRHGIELTGSATTGTLVQNNFTGVTPSTFPSGSKAIPNALAGIALLNGASGNDIGGTSRGNIVAGNTGDGVLIDHADGNVVRGNRIGIVGLTTGIFPNGGAGVHVNDSLATRIGSIAGSELNIISYNLGAGILVTDTSIVTARGNIMEANGQLALDLGGGTQNAAGVTANDAGDGDTGPNALLNFPTLTSAVLVSGATYAVTGAYDGAPNSTFTLDLYANAVADPAGFGEALARLASFSVTTDSAGHADFTQSVNLPGSAPFGGPISPIFTAQATLGNGTSGPSSEFSNTLGGGSTPPASDALFFTGQALGSRVEIRKAATGELVRTFAAFHPKFTGGVRVAAGDVNGDGFEDVIVGAGNGGGARVRVFDGHNTSAGRPVLLYDFFPYGNGYRGGLNVAAGDVDGDEKADIIVSPSAGSSGLVKIFSGATGSLHTSFLAFGRGASGVRVAAGDINGDGHADIIAGTGTGSAVRVFDGQNTANILKEFRAFPVAYRGGVSVAAGDVNGDGLDDVIVGASRDSNLARIFFSGSTGGVAQFSAFAGVGRGINVGALDLNADGIADIITAQGRGAAPRIRIYDGSSILDDRPTAVLTRNVFTFDPAYLGGVFVS